MLTIIFPYRNRDLTRLRNSFESLKIQSDKEFEIYFVDYGSKLDLAHKVEELCNEYEFIKYSYYYTEFQPWNKSRALNLVIKNLETDFCFVADVDLIFHSRFIEKAKELQSLKKAVYFQVGFLKSGISSATAMFSSPDLRKSTYEATGLTMFPVKILQKFKGFDEFYHFWGAEDTDMHVRLKNAGFSIDFYDKEILLLHQWHQSYRRSEKKGLTKDLQLKGVVQLNHRHLEYAIKEKITYVNGKGWGNCMTRNEQESLKKTEVVQVLGNDKKGINHLLFAVFPSIRNKNYRVLIKNDPFQYSLKYKIKKLLKKKVPEYYSLKKINDKLLLHLISFYRDQPYLIKINDDLNEIEVAVTFGEVNKQCGEEQIGH